MSMTALSPMGRVPQRRPVPPRVKPHRRPGPWLAFLTVLVLIAIIVWWKVLGAANKDDNQAQGCGVQATNSVIHIDPRTVQVRVYNATVRDGLARTVSTALRARKFKVLAASNDPLADIRKVDGVAEIRYGPKGEQQALLLSFWFPGSKMLLDKRTDAIVDLAVGPGYKTIANDKQVTQAKEDALAGKTAVTCAP
jgi:LytR cell envelope-related transcriptional attenuator